MPARNALPNARQVRAPKTGELIAGYIRTRIVKHELEPGDMLPTESELMEQFGVSRPTLREAFRILEAESLISVRRGVGGGALVTTPDPAIGARYVGLLLQLEGTTIADVYEARTALEPICAGMMAGRQATEDLKDLDFAISRVADLIDAGPGGIPDARLWTQRTYDVHDVVLKGSGNKTLALQGRLLQEVVSLHYAATVPDKFPADSKPERFRKVLLSHRKLAKLVAAGDSEGAEAHWLRHMQTGAKALLGDDIKNKSIVDLFD